MTVVNRIEMQTTMFRFQLNRCFEAAALSRNAAIYLYMRLILQGAPGLPKDIGCEPVRLDRFEPLFALFFILASELAINFFTHGTDSESHWFAAANVHLGALSEERRGFVPINVDPVPWHQLK